MELYDTARQAVARFEPRENRAGIYVCGITPYDAAHVGHAFTYHVFDVIARRLEADGITVRSVRNITDVDDDILRVARLRGVDYRALGDAQVASFDSDMADIGLRAVDAAPRASAHVDEMVRWIARLTDGGYAYAVDGWVYFDSAMYPDYGRLSRLEQPVMVELSRERGGNPDDPRKRNPLDFVLWQPSLDNEPRWPSPWSHGRPGWHIECSVLATGELGHPVDIHGGGDDLIYPHHESEIAQAEAAGVAPYVRHWVHVAMVCKDGVKMSKSLGNLVFVRDLLDDVPGATVRLMLAAHHYRTSWTYETAELIDAEARRTRYQRAAQVGNRISAGLATQLRNGFLARIDDDLDTPGALSVLDQAADRLLAGDGAGDADGIEGDDVLGPMLAIIGARSASVVA